MRLIWNRCQWWLFCSVFGAASTKILFLQLFRPHSLSITFLLPCWLEFGSEQLYSCHRVTDWARRIPYFCYFLLLGSRSAVKSNVTAVNPSHRYEPLVPAVHLLRADQSSLISGLCFLWQNPASMMQIYILAHNQVDLRELLLWLHPRTSPITANSH